MKITCGENDPVYSTKDKLKHATICTFCKYGNLCAGVLHGYMKFAVRKHS